MKFTLVMAATAIALNVSLAEVSVADTPAAGGVAEIVVTAQRVEALASRTPLALTVLTAADLRAQGRSDPVQLANAVPNLAITDKGGAMQITIRGVTSTDATEKGDPSAAFLVDGVYIARPQVQIVSFYDLARVEVLRGPQGTLYGRNTTAGAINVISNTPTRNFELSADATAGNFGRYRLNGMINVPLCDAVQVRAAVNSDRRRPHSPRSGWR